MLTITRVGNVITVVETTMSFLKTWTKTVVYNLDTKRSKTNNDPWQDMSHESVAWVNKHYVPKATVINPDN